MIKAVLFDVDGTLIDSFHSNLNFYRKIFDLAGYPNYPDAETYQTSFHLPLRESFAHLSPDKSKEMIDRLFDIFKSIDSSEKEPFILMPNVKPVLDQLKTKYKLGIVTGRQELSVAEFLEETELESHFGTVIHHGIYEHPKPHPQPLQLAMEELNVSPEETVYIGDTWVDIESSQAAGVKPILYHYEITGNHTLDGAYAIIKDYLELPGLLESMD